MTQEEKLEEAKRLYQTANADQRYVLESLFPELKESWDEIVRKKLVDLLYKVYANTNYITCAEHEEAIAWLKKQKPIRWNESIERTKWISIEDWNCMSHSQYAWNFFVVELVNKIGYMGKHIVCVMDRDGSFHVDCDYGKIINMTKVAAILPIEPYDKSLKDMEEQQ